MTPDEVRKRVRNLNEPVGYGAGRIAGNSSIGERYALAVEVFTAIAEGRCTYPQICAREMLELNEK